MQTATLNQPRAATLADLRVGDACFVLSTIGSRVYASLGTVTDRTDWTLRVQRGATHPVPGQEGGPASFNMDGRYLGRNCPMLSIAVALPEGARRQGSLAVAS